MRDFWEANVYDKKHAFVSNYGMELVDLLSPGKTEKILDVGCGTGDLSFRIAENGAQVDGIDMSPNMIEWARKKYPSLSFKVVNLYELPQTNKYDAIFSNAVLHWVTDPMKALENFYRSLRQGGRIVAEFGGKDNVRQIRKAIHAAYQELFPFASPLKEPWYFPSMGEYTMLLEKAGFTVHYAKYYSRPTPLEGKDGISNWLFQFAASMLEHLSDREKKDLIHEVENRLHPVIFQNGQWIADYCRLQVMAVKK